MKGTHILGLVTATLWALLLIMGLGGIDSIRSQHVPGFPSTGQLRYYVYFPAASLALVIAAWVLAAHWRQFKVPAVILIALALVALPGYLFFYTGGM
jgi:hypothetical protein